MDPKQKSEAPTTSLEFSISLFFLSTHFTQTCKSSVKPVHHFLATSVYICMSVELRSDRILTNLTLYSPVPHCKKSVVTLDMYITWKYICLNLTKISSDRHEIWHADAKLNFKTILLLEIV